MAREIGRPDREYERRLRSFYERKDDRGQAIARIGRGRGVLVERSAYEEFMAGLEKAVRAIVVAIGFGLAGYYFYRQLLGG